jgi:hypothetical protein
MAWIYPQRQNKSLFASFSSEKEDSSFFCWAFRMMHLAAFMNARQR